TTVATAVGGSGLTIIRNTNPTNLASVVTAAGSTGIRVTSASLIAHTLPGGQASSGLYFPGNPPYTYNLAVPGIVLSSRAVLDYQTGTNSSAGNTTAYGVTATPAQEALLDPITGVGTNNFTHFDATQLDIRFDMEPGFNQVTFHVVFGSDEYPEFVGSIFIDGFGIYLNGTNIAFTGGAPVNINHPDMRPLLGTELDGVLAPNGNPILTFSAAVAP